MVTLVPCYGIICIDESHVAVERHCTMFMSLYEQGYAVTLVLPYMRSLRQRAIRAGHAAYKYDLHSI